MKLPENFTEDLVNLVIEIQQCAAPTFDEGRRAQLVAEKFSTAGLTDVSVDATRNAYGRLPGAGDRPLVISAHLDTVFPDLDALPVRREEDKLYGPGIGDNSLGVAALFGLLSLIKANKFKPAGDIWFIGNSGEEGLGDLGGMKAVVERFGSQPVAYLVLEGMGLERIVHAGLGSKRYRVDVATQGGHSWADYGKPSAIHEMSALIGELLRIRIPRKPRTSFNVGKINGGTSVNTIAGKASIEIDLRSVDNRTLQEKASQVLAVIERANRAGVTVSATPIGDRPTGDLPKNHPLVSLAKKALKRQNLKADLDISSTDCNIPLSKGVPSICLGVTHGKFAHTYEEYIDLEPIEAGMRQLYEVVSKVWRIGKPTS